MHAPAPKRFRDALPFQLRPSNLKTQKGSRPMGGFLHLPDKSRLLAVEQDVVIRGDGPQVVRNHDLHGVHART